MLEEVFDTDSRQLQANLSGNMSAYYHEDLKEAYRRGYRQVKRNLIFSFVA
jgi:hypothetical protein